jgi:predicted nucleic acid-binding protein
MARSRPAALVADASVIVKWFVNEPFTDPSLRLKKAHVELTTRVVVPALAKYEILNALKYSGEFGTEELLRISNDLDNYQFLEVPLERRYSEATVNIASRFGTTIYDSAYIAVGQEKELPVFTADEKLLVKTHELGFVHHIREYS